MPRVRLYMNIPTLMCIILGYVHYTKSSDILCPCTMSCWTFLAQSCIEKFNSQQAIFNNICSVVGTWSWQALLPPTLPNSCSYKPRVFPLWLYCFCCMLSWLSHFNPSTDHLFVGSGSHIEVTCYSRREPDCLTNSQTPYYSACFAGRQRLFPHWPSPTTLKYSFYFNSFISHFCSFARQRAISSQKGKTFLCSQRIDTHMHTLNPYQCHGKPLGLTDILHLWSNRMQICPWHIELKTKREINGALPYSHTALPKLEFSWFAMDWGLQLVQNLAITRFDSVTVLRV